MAKPDLPSPKPIDLSLEPEIQHALDQKTKPLGALGRLEAIAKQVALVQRTVSPSADSCELLIFAADHGIAQSGVSAYPAEVTRQMVFNFLDGGAAANVFAKQNEVTLRVVDAGVSGEPIVHPELISNRIGSGTRNFLDEPAMSTNEACEALESGVQLGQAATSEFMGQRQQSSL